MDRVHAKRGTWTVPQVPSAKEGKEPVASPTVAEILTRTLTQNNHPFPNWPVAAFWPFAISPSFFLMAKHPENCEICQRIAQIRRAEHPGFLAELPTGYAVLGDSQFFRGYCLLLCRETAADLEELAPDFRQQFLADMAKLSAAVARVTGAHKMNLESLGNMVPHLHWHVFPRQLSEAEPLKPVWLVMPQGDEAQQHAFDAERDAELLKQLRDELRAG